MPEQLFSTLESAAEGVSAIKALQVANDKGIPIYTVNQTNINTVLPQLEVDIQVKEDIQDAVNAGKEVTVSKTNISFNGWIGCGYIVINPETGAGAYMLSGGTNGGVLLVALMLLTAIALLALAVIIGPVAVVIVALLMPFYLAFQAWLATQASEKARNCVASVLISILSVFTFMRVFPPPYGSLFDPIKRLFGLTVGSSTNRVVNGCYEG